MGRDSIARPAGRDWFQQIPAAQRVTVNAAAKWLKAIPWQWFITLTFPWNVRQETAAGKLRNFVNIIEQHLKSNVCIVAGMESKSRHSGERVPWHYHLLLASRATIPREAIVALWHGQVASRAAKPSIADSVQADRYDKHQRGVEYCLKRMGDNSGDWLFRRLPIFMPYGPRKPNHRTVRGARRAARPLT